MKIKDLPKSSRPREKALMYGIEHLSDEELLALIIGSGVKNKSALEIASSLINTYGNLFYLSKAKLMSLKSEFGLSQISALKLEATFEYHSRLMTSKYLDGIELKSLKDVYARYKYLENNEHELLLLLMLDRKSKIIKEKVLYQGTNNALNIDLKEVMVELLQANTKKFVLIHNHPDGNIKPSLEDEKATSLIASKAYSLGIKLIDHLIIYQGGYYSFKENNRLSKLTGSFLKV